MREDTSGLMFTAKADGSIILEVVDYNVSEFDGSDWECQYGLTKENAEKLYVELKKQYSGTFEQMLVARFGHTFNIPEFEKFCDEHKIDYKRFTWF